MNWVKDKAGYYRKENLKEFFADLKKHQKWLLATTFILILIQVLFSIFFSGIDFPYILGRILNLIFSPKTVLNEILHLDFYDWREVIFPILAFVVNLIFLHKRKFSYIICSINIIVKLLNPFVQLLPLVFYDKYF